ncbi:MAG: RNA methyltransferase [Pirellulaceae bacterium]|nr:RNA methyltransferase [Pirellulaceae bacterium]
MKPTIESLQNPKIKLAVRLRDSRARRKAGLILIDGEREIEVARRAGVRMDTIYCESQHWDELGNSALCQAWPAKLLQLVSERVFEKIGYGERSSGVVAVAHLPPLSLEELTATLNARGLVEPLVMVLDRAEKPGNIGAVARTAASAGADALILVDPACEVFNPNAIRASLGTVFSLPIAVVNLPQLENWVTQQQMRLLRACVDGSQSMWQADMTGPLAIALGSEALGLGEQWQKAKWPAITIPMVQGADSLNLSVSAAVLCYEALRQRCLSGPKVQ